MIGFPYTMELYVIQVKTGEEQKYIQLFQSIYSSYAQNLDFHTPTRALFIRRQGKVRKEQKPLFPGYIFLELPEFTTKLYQALKGISGFFRFLPDNQRIQPLNQDASDLIVQLIHYGNPLGISKVTFQEDGKIRVLSGPLEGLEGKIVKVDRRKRRARIRLDMYETAHLIDLGFEELEPAGAENR